MKTDILLSIICPVYNAEKTIGRLIEQLEKQKFKNYELIFVNDESTDNSVTIIKNKMKENKNIILVSQKNSGVGPARNTGLSIARGKFITFIDNDDFHEKNYFEEIVPILQNNKIELLCYGFNVIDSNNNISFRIPEFKCEELILKKNEGIINYLNGKFSQMFDNVNWNKIYVNEIIKKHKILFPNDRGAMEDLVFNMKYFTKISKINLLNKKLCNYSMDFNPLLNKKYYTDGNEYIFRMYNILEKICIDNSVDDYENYLSLFFLRRIPAVIRNQANNPSFKTGIMMINQFYNNKNIKKILKKIKIKHLDGKLWICFIIYKLHLSKILFVTMRIYKKMR